MILQICEDCGHVINDPEKTPLQAYAKEKYCLDVCDSCLHSYGYEDILAEFEKEQK